MEIFTNSASQTKKLASNLAKKFKGGEIIALYGNLGYGKTTFVQGFVEGLGFKDKVQSPTFVFVRFYGSKPRIAHIDLYRIKSEEEVLDLGLSELLEDENTICLIEWPEKMGRLLPKNILKIRFKFVSKNVRNISLKKDTPCTMRLYLDTADRNKKIIKIFKGSKVIGKVSGIEDEFILIKKILKNSNVSIDDISRIDVNKGPGSFTGLKIGVSIANSFNYSKGKIKSWEDLIFPEYGAEPNIGRKRG